VEDIGDVLHVGVVQLRVFAALEQQLLDALWVGALVSDTKGHCCNAIYILIFLNLVGMLSLACGKNSQHLILVESAQSIHLNFIILISAIIIKVKYHLIPTLLQSASSIY
jgi:hypothetical protein